MGHGGYTLELSLKDSVSAGLKDMGRALSNVRELVGSLRADVSALNKESGQAVSGLDLGKLAEGAADHLEGLSKGALQELDAAFRDSGKTMADYYAERRRQAGETADMERENALEQAERMAQELEARKDAYQAELEAFVAHGQNWAEAQQAQADREVSIKAEQAEREKAIDAQRLEGALSLAGGRHEAGLRVRPCPEQGRVPAVSGTGHRRGHHQHLQGRSGRVRAGHGVGRPGGGRNHGRHRRRRGHGPCCRHQEHAAERVRVRRAHRRAG